MRQAVVLIHGIGRQQPLDTLRSFLDGMVSGDEYWSKPDRLSESLELRRFTLGSDSRTTPPTDFYEVYWAHHMQDGQFSGTLMWLSRVVASKPFWKVESSLRPLFGTIQLLGLAATVLIAWSIGASVLEADTALSDIFAQWQTYAGVALGGLQFVAGRFLTGSLADAARYLTPNPANIEARRRVRNQGTGLVRALHDDGRYFRVVIVGHSLGSVIAYDIVRQLWDELRHPDPRRAGKQPEATSFDDAVADLHNASPRDAGRAIESFQQAQHRLWRENRHRGAPWLVTDLVTLGSPLAHAPLLLTTRRVAIERRKREREFPTCPPTPGSDGATLYSQQYQSSFDVEAEPLIRNFLVGHHGAPFGPTRWSNLYFPHRWLLMGDLIGGPVRPQFGAGVRDVPVRPAFDSWRAVLRGIFPIAHGAYWTQQLGRVVPQRDARRAIDEKTGTKDALIALRAALRLQSFRSRESWPPPDPPPANA